jgi:hypothetical protein
VSFSSHYTASNGGDIMPSKSQCGELAKNIVDQYDLDEPMPVTLRFDADITNKYVDHGFDLSDGLTVPVEQDLYKGSSQSWLSPECLTIDCSNVVPKITSKQSYLAP